MTLERSAGGLVRHNAKFILVYQINTKSWSFPKGHIEDNESELVAAQREVFEETGLRDITLIKPLGSYIRPSKKGLQIKKHISIFLFQTDQHHITPIEKDIGQCQWLTPGEIIDKLTYPEDRSFFKKVLPIIL